MTVTYADAGDRALVALADEFAAALTAINPDLTVTLVITGCGSSTFLGLNVVGPDESIVIGTYDSDWVTFAATSSCEAFPLYIGDGLDELVDLTVKRITTGIPV
jgi:hypothetical protein